ncbi:MAG TPA: hypothetical protein VFB21_06545 [Chthonomonadaceae bacterium]|nr:hypothetical protein [Chthonomonadaceae bacterium]
MNTVSSLHGSQGDLQKKIPIAAAAIIVLMLLFPPKVVFNTNPIMNVTQTQSAGYQFLFSDPSAEQKQAARLLLGDEVDKYVGSHIEWGKLFLQLLVVGGVAFAASRFLANPNSRRMEGSAS